MPWPCGPAYRPLLEWRHFPRRFSGCQDCVSDSRYWRQRWPSAPRRLLMPEWRQMTIQSRWDGQRHSPVTSLRVCEAIFLLSAMTTQRCDRLLGHLSWFLISRFSYSSYLRASPSMASGEIHETKSGRSSHWPARREHRVTAFPRPTSSPLCAGLGSLYTQP